MKTQIFYFSGTGNSLVVARDLAKRLGDTELTDIARETTRNVETTAERIGIVFPVYMFGLPLIVGRFCKRFTVKGNPYIFAVATCGGTPGAALAHVGHALKERGLSLDAGFVVKMPGNYTPLYGAPPEAKQQELFGAEKTKVEEIAEAVAAGNTGILEKSNVVVNTLLSGFLYRAGAARIPMSDHKFRVDENCNGCGLCEKVCPVRNIRMAAGLPTWLHHCEQCLACLQWCPREAIQIGKSTVGRKRYHHPAVKAADFMKA